MIVCLDLVLLRYDYRLDSIATLLIDYYFLIQLLSSFNCTVTQNTHRADDDHSNTYEHGNVVINNCVHFVAGGYLCGSA